MSYQDRWIKGKAISYGYRECAERYNLIADFCHEKYGNEKFTVADIGANLCYFGLRLTEEFPHCSVIAFEFYLVDRARKLIRENEADRVLLLNHKLKLADFPVLSSLCHFNVILALSIIHHLHPVTQWVDAMRRLADHLIIECAIDDSRARPHENYIPPDDAVILGYGESHIKNDVLRPIIYLSGVK